jgi:hypothetical protein
VVGEVDGFGEVLSFAEGDGQGAVEDVAGGGSVYGFHGWGLEVGGGFAVPDQGSVATEGDDDYGDAAFT